MHSRLARSEPLRNQSLRYRGAVGLTALAAAVCLTVSACSSSGPGTTSSGASASGSTSTETTTTLNVGALPIGDDAPLFVAIKKGYFAQEHLDVKAHVLQGGAAIASAIVGGSLQFGFGAVANLILGRAKGLPLKMVAAGNRAASDPSAAWSGILVGKDSDITSVSQLAGKTVAVNARQGANELALDAILQANGVDVSSVHVVSVPFPTMPSTLSSGHVDAVTEVEPFVSAIEGSGGKMISPLFQGEEPGLAVAGYLTTDKVIKDSPDVVKRFVTALNKGLDYAQNNPDYVRQIIPSYTQIPAATAQKMKLSPYGSQVNTTSIQNQEKLMLKFGWLKTQPAISDLVWSGATTQ